MPKLITFLPCKSVILAKDETASVIGIMTDIMFQGLPEIVPADAAVPFEWYLFVVWQIEDNNKDKKWEQRTRLVNREGQTAKFDSLAEFKADSNKEIHRMIASVPGFPVVPSGQYQLEVSFREVGTNDWQGIHTYPFRVLHG